MGELSYQSKEVLMVDLENFKNTVLKLQMFIYVVFLGHFEMVTYLLDAGADHEHKTDEMHTALMEACMDGHVEVAKLLLDSGAQV